MNHEDLLMNPLFVNKLKTNPQQSVNYKFYKKRIYALSKQLLNKRNLNDVPLTVKESFDNYLKNCVSYFEFIDCSDLMQNEYSGLGENSTLSDDENDISLEEANKKLIAVKTTTNKIENFMNVYQTKPEPPVFPEQKKLNIKDKAHKNKGLKKNIPK